MHSATPQQPLTTWSTHQMIVCGFAKHKQQQQPNNQESFHCSHNILLHFARCAWSTIFAQVMSLNDTCFPSGQAPLHKTSMKIDTCDSCDIENTQVSKVSTTPSCFVTRRNTPLSYGHAVTSAPDDFFVTSSIEIHSSHMDSMLLSVSPMQQHVSASAVRALG